MIVDVTKKEVMEIRTVKISAKVNDLFTLFVSTPDGSRDYCYDGYVPEFFPDGGGDYLNLDIDINTGQILNWKKPSSQELGEFISEECDE